jgi:HipA-like protein
VRRLLEVRTAQRSERSALLTAEGWELLVAAELLELDESSEALEVVRSRLHANDPALRAYAAMVLLGAGVDVAESVEVLAAAVKDGVWSEIVPATVRLMVSRTAAKLLRSSPEPLASQVRQTLRAGRSRLLRAVVPAAAPGGAPGRRTAEEEATSPDFFARWFLDLPDEVPLTEDVIAGRLRELDPDAAVTALEKVAELDLVPAEWPTMAIELAARCDEPYHQFVLARLLGDRATLRRLADEAHGDLSVADDAKWTLRQAEAFDAVLRVGRLRRGEVRLAGRYAGVLEELPGRRTRFVYATEYLLDADARPLAPTMPLRRAPYERDGLHPYFANLLPQGAMLDIKARAHRLNASDSFGLLLALGADLPGAVEVFEADEE